MMETMFRVYGVEDAHPGAPYGRPVQIRVFQVALLIVDWGGKDDWFRLKSKIDNPKSTIPASPRNAVSFQAI
jgi:hypothetical protein